MARIDRTRLQGARFPVSIEIQTRIDDLDVNQHVNNAASAVILQEARARLHMDTGIRQSLSGLRMMVAAMTIEYAAELHHPDPITIHSGVLAIGRSSFTLGQVARQRGRDAIYAEATMVIADANGSIAMPGPLRAALEAVLIPIE